MRRKLALLAGAGMVTLVVVIIMNAVSWQSGRHPAPLIATLSDRMGPNTIRVRPLGRPLLSAEQVTPKPKPDKLVRDVQIELAHLNIYSDTIDGLKGPRTRDAIAAYERLHGLTVSGTASEQLLDHIRFNRRIAEAIKTPLPPENADPRVLLVQNGLSELGYNPGPVDGHLGKQTRDAIRSFERDRRLPATGLITDRLVDELRKVTGTSALNAG